MPFWLVLKPIWDAVGPYLLIGLGLVMLGQAAGLPVAEAILSGLVDAVLGFLGWLWSTIVGILADQVVDQINPLSIALESPVAAG